MSIVGWLARHVAFDSARAQPVAKSGPCSHAARPGSLPPSELHVSSGGNCFDTRQARSCSRTPQSYLLRSQPGGRAAVVLPYCRQAYGGGPARRCGGAKPAAISLKGWRGSTRSSGAFRLPGDHGTSGSTWRASGDVTLPCGCSGLGPIIRGGIFHLIRQFEILWRDINALAGNCRRIQATVKWCDEGVDQSQSHQNGQDIKRLAGACEKVPIGLPTGSGRSNRYEPHQKCDWDARDSSIAIR